MTDFHPDCTINLLVEAQGKPAKHAWVCSISRVKLGRVVLARKFLGLVSREEAELAALEFGLEQAQRFMQEKVELASAFEAERWFAERGVRDPELRGRASGVARIWDTFRFRRFSRLAPEAVRELRAEAESAYRRPRAPRKGE